MTIAIKGRAVKLDVTAEKQVAAGEAREPEVEIEIGRRSKEPCYREMQDGGRRRADPRVLSAAATRDDLQRGGLVVATHIQRAERRERHAQVAGAQGVAMGLDGALGAHRGPSAGRPDAR